MRLLDFYYSEYYYYSQQQVATTSREKQDRHGTSAVRRYTGSSRESDNRKNSHLSYLIDHIHTPEYPSSYNRREWQKAVIPSFAAENCRNAHAYDIQSLHQQPLQLKSNQSAIFYTIYYQVTVDIKRLRDRLNKPFVVVLRHNSASPMLYIPRLLPYPRLCKQNIPMQELLKTHILNLLQQLPNLRQSMHHLCFHNQG